MEKNIGTEESNIRMLVGAFLILFALFLVESNIVKIVLAVLASILAGTAFIRICPINMLLKRNTAEPNDENVAPEIAIGDVPVSETVDERENATEDSEVTEKILDEGDSFEGGEVEEESEVNK